MTRNALLLLGTIALVALLGGTITGLVVYDGTGYVAPGEVVVAEEEILECCRFDDGGAEKSCSVIRPYDCSYCDDFC